MTYCLIAQARAEGLVEALEVLRAPDSSRLERLYQMEMVADTVTRAWTCTSARTAHDRPGFRLEYVAGASQHPPGAMPSPAGMSWTAPVDAGDSGGLAWGAAGSGALHALSRGHPRYLAQARRALRPGGRAYRGVTPAGPLTKILLTSKQAVLRGGL